MIVIVNAETLAINPTALVQAEYELIQLPLYLFIPGAVYGTASGRHFV